MTENNSTACGPQWSALLSAGLVLVTLMGPVSEMKHWDRWDAVHWAAHLLIWMMPPVVFWLNLQGIKRDLAAEENHRGLRLMCRIVALLAGLAALVIAVVSIRSNKMTGVETLQLGWFVATCVTFGLILRRFKALPCPSLKRP